MYQEDDRRKEFRCTCGDKLSFGCMQWIPEIKKNKVVCQSCNKILVLNREEDYGKFKELQKAFNGD